MENNNLNYIPYGAAALGAVLGNVLYKKYPKFGTAGRLLAIGIGAVSGYYISDKIIGGDDSDDFRNAAGSPHCDRICRRDCSAGQAAGVTIGGKCDKNGKCICYNLTVRDENQLLAEGNNPAALSAVRNFFNAAGGGDDRRRNERCAKHDAGKLDCAQGLKWNKVLCACVDSRPQNQ